MREKTRFTPLENAVQKAQISLAGFTLIEALIVLVVLGILATLALTNYTSYREDVLDKEAGANLRLIQAAERIYNIENRPSYYPSAGSETDINNINRFLKLDIDERNWDYEVFNNGCSQSTQAGRTLRLRINEDDPSEAACP